MGVYIGLLIHDLAFGVVMGGIGVIALAGIIVSNNIILIETYDRLAATLISPSVIQMRDIILKTCAQRARPVILTQLTTVLGLMPIMFGITVDFLNLEITVGAPSTQWWVLLSTCIVYGATFASIMTLIATPCMLMARVRYRSWRKKSLV
jgi:multidrug efflux pump